MSDDCLNPDCPRQGAARPSADTETLREQVEKLAKLYRRLGEDMDGPGADAFHDAALDLHRALDAR